MEFDYFAEEPAVSSENIKTVHYLFSLENNVIIQTNETGFCIRSDPLLRTYLATVLAGKSLPGFSHLGKVTISDEQIRPVIDGLSYKAHVEQRLSRVNKAISMHTEQIKSCLQNIHQGSIGS